MAKKTYIDFLNENFEIDSSGKPHHKSTCPNHIVTDSILGGFIKVLAENQDQYEPVTGLTIQKMVKTWRKQAPVKK